MTDETVGLGWFAIALAVIVYGSGVGALGFVVWWFGRYGRHLVRVGRRPVLAPVSGIVVMSVYYVGVPLVATLVLSSLWEPPAESEVLDPATVAQQNLVFFLLSLMSVFAWVSMRRRQQDREWTSRLRTYWKETDRGWDANEPVALLTCVRVAVTTLVVSWPIIVLSGNFLRIVSQWTTGEKEDGLAHEVLKTLSDAPLSESWPWMMIGSVILLAPIIEEVVYRGALQAALRPATRSPWVSIVMTGSLFGLMHAQSATWIAIPGLVFFGIALGYTYERTGRIITPILTHVLFNVGNISILLLSRGA